MEPLRREQMMRMVVTGSRRRSGCRACPESNRVHSTRRRSLYALLHPLRRRISVRASRQGEERQQRDVPAGVAFPGPGDGRLAGVVLGVEVGPRVDEHAADPGLAVLRGAVEGRVPLVVALVEEVAVGARPVHLPHENLRDGLVPLAGRDVQRRRAVVRRRGGVSAELQQHFNDVVVPGFACGVQAGPLRLRVPPPSERSVAQ